MTVTLNEAALAHLLEDPNGAVGRRVALRAEQVTEQASQNASGEPLGILTGATHSDIHFEIQVNPLQAVVSTRAAKDFQGAQFSYSAWWDENGKPWMTSALETLTPLGWEVKRRGR